MVYMHECASACEYRENCTMGQLEVQDGAPATQAVPKDTTQRGAPASTGSPDKLDASGDGGAASVAKDTTKRGAPASTGSPDKLDASHKV
jgi:hypothetical protein